MYKAIIFDLDGTILDTLGDLHASVNYALKSYGYPLRSECDVCAFVGDGIKKLIERAVPANLDDASIQKVLECFKEHYGKNCNVNTKPYDGIIDCLKMLKSKGTKLAVVTNKAHFAAVPMCKKYFKNLIDATIGETDGTPKKPCPDMLNKAMHLLGVSKQDTLYVGDSDVDIQTAKNAGVNCLCVSWGFRSEEFLIKCGAANIAHNAKELFEFTQ